MSYILDALKKSDKERSELHQTSTPETSSGSAPAANRRLPVVIMIVLIALICGWWLTQPDTEHSSTIEQPASKRASAEAASPATDPADHSAAEPEPVSPIHRMIQIEDEIDVTAPISPQTPVAALNSAESGVGKPSFELQQSLPPLTIEAHIYDADASARMVIINGSVYREGQRIDHDLKLEEITPDGVILTYRGSTFHRGTFE